MPQRTLFGKWRPAPGWETKYKINRMGAVRSQYSGTIIHSQTDSSRSVDLYSDGQKRANDLARLVLRAFGNPPSGPWVAKHIDGDGSNNRIANLKAIPENCLADHNVDGELVEDLSNWERVPKLENKFLVHESGKIVSTRWNRIVEPYKNENRRGGCYISFKKDGKTMKKSPGRLIIRTFQDPPSEKWVVHKIDDEEGTKVSNLVPRPRSSMSYGKPQKKPAYKKVYNQYKNNAKSRDIPFHLDKKDFDEICQRDCYYCGASPSYRKDIRDKANGVDRISSDVGYVRENCVPCCSGCNMAKNNASASDFINRAVRIANLHSPDHIRIPRSSVTPTKDL